MPMLIGVPPDQLSTLCAYANDFVRLCLCQCLHGVSPDLLSTLCAYGLGLCPCRRGCPRAPIDLAYTYGYATTFRGAGGGANL